MTRRRSLWGLHRGVLRAGSGAHGRGYKQNAGLGTRRMWLERDLRSRQRPPCEQRRGDRARLAEEGTVEGGGLAERDCEGVGGGALFYGFGLGNEVPGVVGLAPAWPRNRYETVAAEI